MKSIKILSLAIACIAMTSTIYAQDKKETFKVSGNCGMCKSKIEKAAKDAGAKDAEWDSETKMLTVAYKSSSTNTAKIQQKIAAVGYDNAGAKATAEAYNKLHGCCKYERSGSEAKEACCSGDKKCEHESTHAAKMDCCKDGKCTKAGHDGKNCCTAEDCCKDGKCSKEGHAGADCCKKS